VEEIVDKLRPLSFREHVNTVLQRQRDIETNWGQFTRWLRIETRECDKYQVTTRSSQLSNYETVKGKPNALRSSNPTSRGSPTDQIKSKKSKKERGKKSRDNSDSSSKDKEQAPICLNTSSCPNERHFVRDCPKSLKKDRKALLAKYREKMRPRDANPPRQMIRQNVLE
jgi:hypothetical protein